MNKERLQEIKDSIDLRLTVAKSIGIGNELAEEKKELYDEVVRLNNVIDELEKWLIEQSEKIWDDNNYLDDVLDKLEELKENNNE